MAKTKKYKVPEMKPVDSSQLKAVGHDGKNLFIEFHKGGVYVYPKIDKKHVDGLMKTESKGKYFSEHIKYKTPYEKL